MISGIRTADGQRRTCRTKTNLSKTGKVYHTRPSLLHVAGRIYNHLAVQEAFRTHLLTEPVNSYYNPFGGCNKCVEAPDSEWQIEKFENETWVPA